jgi:DMSO/TMAO reductase YedYZ heme-binding membrane subunit
MRAVGVTRFGGPEVLQIVERPVPEPGLGEVRIRVAAAAVNPTDTVLRSGRHGAPDGLEPPYVPGTGGEICFFLAVSITPLITVTGARWLAPLRRWYGIFFALIGISDAATAAVTTDFSGGIFGRLAGHTFLVTGFFVVLLAVPLLVTANTPAQRLLGRYWKRLQRFTYVLWALIVLHLLLLDDFVPFGGPQGDGDPVFHQRFYQAVAISIPLVVLRLPPVRRWIADTRAAGQQWKVWLAVAPLAALWILGFAFIINEEIFTGTMAITMRPPDN